MKKQSLLSVLYNGIKFLVFNCFHFFTLTIVLVLVARNDGIISIGYIIFCLIYIYKSKYLLLKTNWSYPKALKYFLKMYLIIDIFLNFVF